MTKRELARRKLLAAAVNAALQKKLFNLNQEEDDLNSVLHTEKHVTYAFQAFGKMCIADARDIGFGEIRFNVFVNPKNLQRADFGWLCKTLVILRGSKSEAVAKGWLERECGKYITDSVPEFSSTKDMLDCILSTEVTPKGFELRKSKR